MGYEKGPTYAEMSDEELYRVALANQMTFTVGRLSGALCIGTPLLGWDRERTARVCLIDREMRARWTRFVAFVKAKLEQEFSS